MTRLRLKYILITLSVFIAQILPAQSFDQMDQLYQAKRFDELRKLVEGKSSENAEFLFFKTVFNENGDESVRIYEDLFGKSQGKLKGLIAAKISEYYYAKGFYVKAGEYARYAVYDDVPSESEVQIKKEVYYIQVGAFGYEDNARRMQELLKVRQISADVKIRYINDKKLYCVWIAGADTYQSTVKQADELKLKYKINYQIINP